MHKHLIDGPQSAPLVGELLSDLLRALVAVAFEMLYSFASTLGAR
jgi:hypothetical protein